VACQYQQLECFNHLIQSDTQVDEYSLQYSCETKFIPIIEQVVEQLCDTKLCRPDIMVREICIAGLEVVNHLINRGFDITQCNYYALHCAAETSDVPLAARLIELGFDPRKRNGNVSVLGSAARKPSLEMIRFLIQNGANPHPPDNEPLVAAAESGRKENILELIRHGAMVNLQDYVAFKKAHVSCLRTLYELHRPTDEQFAGFLRNTLTFQKPKNGSWDEYEGYRNFVRACAYHYTQDHELVDRISASAKKDTDNARLKPLLHASDAFQTNWTRILGMIGPVGSAHHSHARIAMSDNWKLLE
jgi:hypothetical protein